MFYDNFMNLLFIFSIALFKINCYNIINILIILYSFCIMQGSDNIEQIAFNLSNIYEL